MMIRDILLDESCAKDMVLNISDQINAKKKLFPNCNN